RRGAKSRHARRRGAARTVPHGPARTPRQPPIHLADANLRFRLPGSGILRALRTRHRQRERRGVLQFGRGGELHRSQHGGWSSAGVDRVSRVRSLPVQENDPLVPLWLNEGLAEYYSTFTVDNGVPSVGKPIESHIDWLRTHRLIPLAELFATTHASRDYHEGDRQAYSTPSPGLSCTTCSLAARTRRRWSTS